ncbi:MAG TPA: hypothetical protein VM938_00330 [Acidimicrobiales bacterium]|nr:hypothetical protein [Acidimicrobiales bacterium]
MADLAWERRQADVPDVWGLDFWAADGSLGGFVAYAFHARTAWYWAGLVGAGRPYLLVRELDVPLPRSSSSAEVRAEALWADMNCETPFDHWSYGLEAFGVALDDPAEALRGERGDRVGLGLDIEWEASGPVDGGDGSYAQRGVVHGEILVGVGGTPETIDFDGVGWRRHEWGGPSDASWWLGADRRAGVAVGEVETLLEAPVAVPGGYLDRRLARLNGEVGWGQWFWSVDPAR